jgi:hypothetical protein
MPVVNLDFTVVVLNDLVLNSCDFLEGWAFKKFHLYSDA